MKNAKAIKSVLKTLQKGAVFQKSDKDFILPSMKVYINGVFFHKAKDKEELIKIIEHHF